ncbi:hypothetical protein RB195_007775 [Necator americanus]|uniref:Uncharacterized protein n=1 Tax=Necator americanus TaxID=51031 RepID=A0ABR1BYX5_NECAM
MVELLSYLPRFKDDSTLRKASSRKNLKKEKKVTSELNSEQMKQSSINQVDKIPASVNVRRVLLHRRMCTNNQERIQG